MINIDAEIYGEFTCKADKCKHSCCKGWEIDIDEDTLEYYKDLDSELGNEIRQNIEWGEDSFFKLTSDERCPFLKDDGLCKIIEELGDDGLCDICRLHPRFFQVINDYNLAGVGLSCEKATELLFDKTSLDFIICDSGKKLSFVELLEMLEINIPQEELSLSDVISNYLQKDKEVAEIDAEIEAIFDVFYETEAIDSNWKNEVLLIKKNYKENTQKCLNDLESSESLKKYDVIYQYIIFRQLELIETYGVSKIIEYGVQSVIFIMLYAIFFGDDQEAVRRWSEQIEYNEDNIMIILERLN